MKLLIDAQLPRRLALALAQADHDALHTLELPDRNRTTDAEVIRMADESERVVMTKDSDFVHSHLLEGRPQRLLLVSTGNISNDSLLTLVQHHMIAIERGFESCRFVELTRSTLILHA